MPPLRRFYLNLGSNILPEQHLVNAVRLLQAQGHILEVSSVWESQAVGSNGPNFLNLSIGFRSELDEGGLKRKVARPIEKTLGRKRTSDKNAPRTIDIDIILMNGRPLNLPLWAQPFVILPMAELIPEYLHPVTGRRLADEAPLAAASLWILRRPELAISVV